MRAYEFITEATAGKITQQQQNASVGLNKFTDAEKWNSDYKQYRLGLALAACDGRNLPPVDFESWVGRWKTAHPYTQLEQDMLKLAYKAAKVEYLDVNRGDLESQEPDDTNTASPLAKPKRNKYGV